MRPYNTNYINDSGIRSILKPRQSMLSWVYALSKNGRSSFHLRTILYLYLSCIL